MLQAEHRDQDAADVDGVALPLGQLLGVRDDVVPGPVLDLLVGGVDARLLEHVDVVVDGRAIRALPRVAVVLAVLLVVEVGDRDQLRRVHVRAGAHVLVELGQGAQVVEVAPPDHRAVQRIRHVLAGHAGQELLEVVAERHVLDVQLDTAVLLGEVLPDVLIPLVHRLAARRAPPAPELDRRSGLARGRLRGRRLGRLGRLLRRLFGLRSLGRRRCRGWARARAGRQDSDGRGAHQRQHRTAAERVTRAIDAQAFPPPAGCGAPIVAQPVDAAGRQGAAGPCPGSGQGSSRCTRRTGGRWWSRRSTWRARRGGRTGQKTSTADGCGSAPSDATARPGPPADRRTRGR